MKITAIHQTVAPISSDIRNAVIDFSKMTTSLVEGKISTGMGISRAITNDLKHLRHPDHGIR